jgi:hypothetical protein
LAAATVALDHQLRQSYVSVALHTGSAVCRVLLLLRPHLYIGLEVHVHLGLQQAREGLQELLVSIRKRVQHLMIKQQQQISQVRKRLQDRERLQDLVVSTAYMTCQAPDQAAAAAFEGLSAARQRITMHPACRLLGVVDLLLIRCTAVRLMCHPVCAANQEHHH